MSYVDLVLVKTEEPGTPVLCYAPRFSSLVRGDSVELEGHVMATVIDSITGNSTDEDFMFVRRMNGMREPHRIIAKIARREFEYEDEAEVFISGAEDADKG